MLDKLKIYFIGENSLNIRNYKSYPDLEGLTIEELWIHANEYGYKEQRQIFNNSFYNNLFYDHYLSEYRKIVLSKEPNFEWKMYNSKSEYYALIDYIKNFDTGSNEINDISYVNPHYSLVAECPNYDYQTFPFAYGAGQWSSALFGLIIPSKSILKKGYFMYLYDSKTEFDSITGVTEYQYNEEKTKIRLDLYINGIKSDYYVEETLDPSRNMLGVLFKKNNINGPSITIDYDEIILEENSVISWYCSDILSKNMNGEYTNFPYNPSRNRFIMILEPYNTRFISYGTNQEIFDSFKNEVETSFNEINEYISNITFDINNEEFTQTINNLNTNISTICGSVISLNTNIDTISGTINTLGNTLFEISDNKQDKINLDTDLSFNNLHILGDITVDGSFNVNNIIQNDITINNQIFVDSSQLEISTQGSGTSIKVSQNGDGPVALFNAGSDGDSLLIDTTGNVIIYKNLEVIGDTSMSKVKIETLDVFKLNLNDVDLQTQIDGKESTIKDDTNITCESVLVTKPLTQFDNELTSKSYVDSGLNKKQGTINTESTLNCERILVKDLIPASNNELSSRAYVDREVSTRHPTIDNENLLNISLVNGLQSALDSKQPNIDEDSNLSCESITVSDATPRTSNTLTSKLYVDYHLATKQKTIYTGDLSITDTDGLEIALSGKHPIIKDDTELKCLRITVNDTNPASNDTLTSRLYVDSGLNKKQDTIKQTTEISCNRIYVNDITPDASNELTSLSYVEERLASKQDKLFNNSLTIENVEGLRTELDGKQLNITEDTDLSFNRIFVKDTNPNASNELTSKSYVDSGLNKKQDTINSDTPLNCESIFVKNIIPSISNELTSLFYVDQEVSTRHPKIDSDTILNCNRILINHINIIPTISNELTSLFYVDDKLGQKQNTIGIGGLTIDNIQDLSNQLINKEPKIKDSTVLICESISVTDTVPRTNDTLTSRSYVDNALANKQNKIEENDLSINFISGLNTILSGLQINKQDNINDNTDISLNNLHVFGDITLDGSFNINNYIQNNITVNDVALDSSYLEITHQGNDIAFKVIQLGSQPVAVFNSGLEGDSLMIDTNGNVKIYKNLDIDGETSMNNVNINTLNVSNFNINNGELTIDKTSGLQDALNDKANKINSDTQIDCFRVRVSDISPGLSNELTSRYYVDDMLGQKQNIINDAGLDIVKINGLQGILEDKQDKIDNNTELNCRRIIVTDYVSPDASGELTSKHYVDTKLSDKQDSIKSNTLISCDRVLVTDISPSEPNELTSKSYVDDELGKKQGSIGEGDLTINKIQDLGTQLSNKQDEIKDNTALSCNSITIQKITPTVSNEVTSKYYVDDKLGQKQNLIGIGDLTIDKIQDLGIQLSNKQDEIDDETQLTFQRVFVSAMNTSASGELTSKYYVDDKLGQKQNLIQETTEISCSRIIVTKEIPTLSGELTSKSYVDIKLDEKQSKIDEDTELTFKRIFVDDISPDASNELTSKSYVDDELGKKQDSIDIGGLTIDNIQDLSNQLISKQPIIDGDTILTFKRIFVDDISPDASNELTSRSYVESVLEDKQDNVTNTTELSCNRIYVVEITPTISNELTSKSYVDDKLTSLKENDLSISFISGLDTILGQKQDEITTTTNLTCNYITAKKLIINENLLFDTIVLRRPRGYSGTSDGYQIHIRELQLWVNGNNVLPQDASSALFTLWNGDKDADLGQYQDYDAENAYDEDFTTIANSAGDGIGSGVLYSDSNVALIINLTSFINIIDIQSFVLYNIGTGSTPADEGRRNRAKGLAIELYNRTDDISLSTPLASTNEIDISGTAFRFDFPSIDTYDNFVESDSSTNIISKSYADEVIVFEMSDVSVGGNLSLGGNLDVSGSIINTELSTTLGNKQDKITTSTDLSFNSITINDLVVNESLNVNNVLTYEKQLLFDTIVIRRPTGNTGATFGGNDDYVINIYELQCWVNNNNLLPETATSLFSLWTNKDVNIGYSDIDYAENIYDEIISESGVSVSPDEYRTNPNVAQILNLSSMVDVYTIQALVLYNRTVNANSQNRAIGLSIELYNRTDDPNLSSPLVSTNEIETSVNVYRYDFPAIDTYSGFVGQDSSTNIVNETYSTREVISITTSNTPFVISSDLSMNGNAIIAGNIEAVEGIFDSVDISDISASGLQGRLTAGTNITITDDNTISISGEIGNKQDLITTSTDLSFRTIEVVEGIFNTVDISDVIGSGLQPLITAGTDLSFNTLTTSDLVVNNNVGIGIDDPERLFHVRGANAIWRLDRDRPSTALQLHQYDTDFINDPLKGFIIGVDASGANNGKFFINDYEQNVAGGSIPRFSIENDGEVIINNKLTITNDINMGGGIIKDNIVYTNYKIPVIDNLLGDGAVFLLCLKDGGDNECVGRMYYQRSSGHDGAGIVDIVVSSRDSTDSTGELPNGFCSYQTNQEFSDSTIPHRFSIISGTYSGIDYIGLKYEGGDTYPFHDIYFDGILKTTGTNSPFQMITNSQFTNQVVLGLNNAELSLLHKSLVINANGNVACNTITVSGNIDASNSNIEAVEGIFDTVNISDVRGSGLQPLITDSNGDATVGNILKIGTNTDDRTSKTIFFGGTFNDNNYDNTVIENRIYSSTGEKSELLLFKGNDIRGGNGPDRIRLRAGQIDFDTFPIQFTNDRITENIRMSILDNGNVGIGTTNPSYNLDVSGTMRITGEGIFDSVNITDISASGLQGRLKAGDNITITDDNTISASVTSGGGGGGGIFGTTDNTNYYTDVNYNIILGQQTNPTNSKLYVNGTITADKLNLTSDKRLKDNIEDICGSLTILRQLYPKKYSKGSDVEIGFIANDVLDINDISFVVSKSETYHTLNYNSLFSLSIQGVKDLDEQVNELKTINKELQQRLESLEQFIYKNM